MFEDRVAELETLARDQGLDFFPVSFEVVPQDIMTEVAAYGLPTRARHWSYGKVYQHQHLYGAMGLSKMYEIVLNSDPGLAFLLDSNPEIANLLVAAHVFAHVDFFKNNLCFADTNRRMVNDAVAHALRIDAYIERYGLEVVEHLMDIGFALDRHTDPHKGLLRQPYPPRRVVEKAHVALPYDDLMDTPTRSITYAVEGERLPPHPERDLLWFLITYAPLEAWQRDVLQIIREESYYFHPQFHTKIMNEGWASYWHAELFHLYEGVWREKIFEVRRTEDDLSFLRNYLTPDLVQRLNLFAYGSNCTHPPGKPCPQCQTAVITARERDAGVEALFAPRYNYGVPRIVIQEVANNTLCLEHLDQATTFLDRQYTNNTLMY